MGSGALIGGGQRRVLTNNKRHRAAACRRGTERSSVPSDLVKLKNEEDGAAPRPAAARRGSVSPIILRHSRGRTRTADAPPTRADPPTYLTAPATAGSAAPPAAAATTTPTCTPPPPCTA